ncbi:MAG: hypothetical protein ACYCV7_05625 [Acidimicrobiales bacterium]
MGSETAQPSPKVGAWQGRPAGLPSGVPPPSVPLSFLVAASVGPVACGVALIWSRTYGVVDPIDGQVVGAAHFAMLATLSMGVLGAIHQFTPVITQRPLRSVRLSGATFISWLSGAWLLPLGFATRQESVVEAGGVFAALAVVLLVVNLSAPLSVRGKGAPVTGLRFATVGFVVTACYGVVYVIDRRENWFDLSGHVVLAHVSVGLFAWLGLAYISVSEKLWPMFLLAHVPGRRRSGWLAVWAVPIGVLLVSPGLLFGVAWLAWCGAAVVAIGLGAHLFSLIMHIRYRRRKADLHLLFVITSAAWLLVGVSLALAAEQTIGRYHHAGVALVAAAVTAFAGWLLVALVGHAHKVVPFILWSALRGRGISQKADGTPLMFADLYDHRWAGIAYGLVTAGIAAVCLGFAASISIAIAIGGGLFAVTGLCVGVNLSVTPIRLLSAQGTDRLARVETSPAP